MAPQFDPSPLLSSTKTSEYSRSHWIALSTIILFGTAIRLALQSGRSFVGDEIGTLIHLDKGYSELFTTTGTWLTMHYFLIVEKFIVEALGRTEATLVALPLLAGIVTIPLVALIARILMPAGASLAAALLVAMNPYLVFQSLNIRSYSLLAALSMAVVLCFLVWTQQPSYRRGCVCGLVTFLLLLAHPNGIYLVLGLAVISSFMVVNGASSFPDSGPITPSVRLQARTWTTLLVPMVAAGLATYAAYAHLLPGFHRMGLKLHDTPPTGLNYLSMVWSQYFSPGFWGWPAAAVMLIAAIKIVQETKALTIPLVLVAVAPVFLSVQGVSHFPWGYSRYLIFTLPLLLILLAYGLSIMASTVRARWTLVMVTIALATTWWPGLKDRFENKTDYPWNSVREELLKNSSPFQALVLDWGAGHNLALASESHPTIKLGQIKNPKTPALATPKTTISTFLVLPNFNSSCAATKQFGRIEIIEFGPGPTDDLLHSIRTCLLEIVEETWPTEAEYAPLYEGIITANKKLGLAGTNPFLPLLLENAQMRLRRNRWMTESMLEHSGNAISSRARKASAPRSPSD